MKKLRFTLFIGKRNVDHGSIRHGKHNITAKAFPYIKRLNELLNETVALAIWVEEKGPLIVEWEESKKPINLNIRPGTLVKLTTKQQVVFLQHICQRKKQEI